MFEHNDGLVRDANWALEHLMLWWVYVSSDPVRMGTLAAAILVLMWAIVTAISIKRWRRRVDRQVARGKQMPRKARKKWVHKYLLSSWERFVESQIVAGVLTEGEGSAAIRMIHRAIDPRGVIQQINDENKLKTPMSVKDRIKYKLSWRVRPFLFTPVRIPGPPVPKAQAEALKQPKPVRGAFLRSDHKPRYKKPITQIS